MPASVGNNTEKIELILDPSIDGEGTNVFSGEGVFGEELFVSLISIGTHEILLTHTSLQGCVDTQTQEINIFDNSEVVKGVSSLQCTDDLALASAPITTIGLNNGSVVVGGVTQILDLIDLQIDVTQTSYTNQVTFPISQVLIPNDPVTPTQWDIDFRGAGTGTIEFIATFKNRSTSVEFDRNQTVTISDPPTLNLRLNNNDGPKDDFISYCEDGGIIEIEGSVVNPIGTYIETLRLDIDGNGTAPDNQQSGLTDNGDGTGTINIALLTNNTDFQYGDQVDIWYTVSSNLTTCDSTKIYTIYVNPKPVADFTIDGNINYDGCVFLAGVNDTPTLFNSDNTSILVGNIVDYSWNMDDENNLSDNNEPKDQYPTHQFVTNGNYTVELVVGSDSFCVSDPTTHEISIGNNPVTSFNFEQIGLSENTIFTNTTNPNPDPNSTVNTITWTVNGGTPVTYVDGTNAEFDQPYEYDFVTAGAHDVTLTTITEKGCTVSKTLNFFTVPEFSVDNSSDYEEDFDNGGSPDNGGWIAWGNNTSWDVGTTGGTDDILSSVDGDNFWVTGVGSIYNADERSYIYSPVFEITNLDRPMLKFESYFDINPKKDGALIEYTVVNAHGDSDNGIDDGDWQILGVEGSGEYWYNNNSISNVPGNDVGNFGWSEESSGWHDSKHSLSGVKQNSGVSKVQFRVAFESGNDPNSNYDGMGFDNVLVGQRTRIVLVENFSSTADASGKTAFENAYINESFSEITNEGTEVVIINYHTDLLGYDPLNDVNPSSPNARAAYYGISTSPRAIIDGTIFDASSPGTFSTWGEREFGLRSLNRASFVVDINLGKDDDTGEIVINGDVTRRDNIAQPETVLVNIAIVEDSVRSSEITIAEGESILSGEDYFEFVLRKMLPNAAGIAINGSDLVKDEAYSIPEQRWVPTQQVDINDLSVVVFLQDEVGKEIYQADKRKVTDIPNQVTSIDSNTTYNFTIYPNPARHYTNLDFGRNIDKDYEVKVIDQFGKQIFSENIASGTRAYILDTKNYLNGLYFIQVVDNGDILERTKLVVMDK